MTSRATAPASSANLGAGFDWLALGLELRCSVEARPSGEWEVRHLGPEQPPESADLVLSTAREAAGEGGPMAIEVSNAIPVGRGLGSSAAVRTATFAAVRRAVGEDPSAADAFAWAAEREGHPDNAAAAAFGGLVAVGPDGTVASLELHRSLVPVVAVPARPLETEEARRVLPDQISHAAASRNAARAGFLVEGLRTGRRELLRAAAGDELHEPYRSGLFPLAGRLVDAAWAAGALLAAWSGAGSSVLALADEAGVETVRSALEETLSGEGRVTALQVAREGVL